MIRKHVSASPAARAPLQELGLVMKNLDQSSLLMYMMRTSQCWSHHKAHSDRVSIRTEIFWSAAAAAEAMSTLRPAGPELTAQLHKIWEPRENIAMGLSRTQPWQHTDIHSPFISNIFYFYVLQLKYFHVSTLSVVNMSPCQHKKSAYNFVPAVSGAGGRERAWHWTGVWLNILLTCGGAGRLDTGNKAVNSVLVLPSWGEHFLKLKIKQLRK